MRPSPAHVGEFGNGYMARVRMHRKHLLSAIDNRSGNFHIAQELDNVRDQPEQPMHS